MIILLFISILVNVYFFLVIMNINRNSLGRESDLLIELKKKEQELFNVRKEIQRAKVYSKESNSI